MNGLRIFAVASLAASSFALVACSGGLASKSPEERVDAVKSAIADPTGNIDADSAQMVFDVSLQQAKFQELSAFLQGVPGLYGSVDASCHSDDKVDLSCSTAGAYTGNVTYDVHTKIGGGGTSTTVELKLEKVCKADACMDGSLVIGVETSEGGALTVMQGSLDMTDGSTSSHGEWGILVDAKADSQTVDLAVFDDSGASYVLETKVSGAEASVTLKGANGEFACTVDGTGASGSCSGAGSFSW